ncbi:MAG TPA: Phenylacetic acid catabolic protein, partial [Candidatus Limnocylindria bacterium]|nr:Phenylacetic acid catabolic protein [Candidatus Limnocylindria bacterium]
MTDPLALDPVLSEQDRSDRRLEFHPGMNDGERFAHFETYVHAGGKVEAGDWMPDEYRGGVLKFVEMHANSELMGVLPEREWILRAPTLRRKLEIG